MFVLFNTTGGKIIVRKDQVKLVKEIIHGASIHLISGESIVVDDDFNTVRSRLLSDE